MKLPEDKLQEAIVNYMGDYRYNEVAFVHRLRDEAPVVQEKLWNTIIAYIYYQARRYEMGLIPANIYEIVRVCKKIKDYALEDEFIDIPSYKYGEVKPPMEYISPV